MKFFITGILLLSSLTALAAKEVNIELSAAEGVEFRRYKFAEADYMAANPTCQQMEPTPAIPIPVRRTKRGPIALEKDKISATKSLGGYCSYKLNDVTTLLVRGNESIILGLYPEADAATEIDLVCTSTGKFLCRQNGESTYNLRLAISNTETTRINVTFE